MKLNDLKIETSRLNFRPLVEEDANALFEYRSNPSVSKFQNWDPSGIEEVMDFIGENGKLEPDVPDSWLQLGIIEKSSNRLIGDFALHFLEEGNPQCEIGYSISPQYWNAKNQSVKSTCKKVGNTTRFNNLLQKEKPISKERKKALYNKGNGCLFFHTYK